MNSAHAAVDIEGAERSGQIVLVCEHASNAFPAPWGELGLTPDQRDAHIAWDPGALGLARGLAAKLEAPLVAACQSRLIYDLNRPPHHTGAMPVQSEIHEIPGNAGLTPDDRSARTEALYLPFHAALGGLVAERLARGQATALVTVHSFTPIWFGQPRAVEFGVIHDADPSFAQAVLEEARRVTELDTRLNEPYSGADGVCHTLALQATPMGLPNVMLELRNDLIADPAAQEAMAATLAPVLQAALSRITANNGEAA
ncbi:MULTISPECIES: N-formylglutamate amidohydrolase [Thioclava]|uniref:N-formylglutamate amidohydrolase n=1 Tax=Thioclava nitratireducens TaxID=1915078 RepID=A0ABN4X6D7_9RHOB|nr:MULTISPECIES: N-formylglutamate amidohydrolase [Thioclava]AQS46665.1 N-formylglutamate amidohydrolase [Thioclava nitratireducens]OWY02187.1 N-formylglutamate amidohydrolase [Thioclava sp. IC9]OWY08429.1 N-formylglutamate amidohydrolase [Thioclava sp. F42-5]OWY13358.1 N-formylglutamate amidohydrolase [Thioclava sp. F34-6]OWY16726.1 N-formylglutamate amidohydrolase [Thioclava sp. JM3]